MTNQRRQDKGQPIGGQFATDQKMESSFSLSDVSIEPEVPALDGLSDVQSTRVVRQYAESAQWASIAISPVEDGDIEDSADSFDIDAGSTQTLYNEAAEAWNGMDDDLKEKVSELDNIEQWAHDMWLTREGHGTGFWDRGDTAYGDVQTRDRLNEYASSLGEGGTFFLNDDHKSVSYDRM